MAREARQEHCANEHQVEGRDEGQLDARPREVLTRGGGCQAPHQRTGRAVLGVRGGGGSTLLRILRSLAVVVVALTVASADAAGPQNTGLGRALATKLMAKKALQAKTRTHTTDFGTEAIGCITLTRRELRDFGYRGHAFLCEEGATSEVLGAVLNPVGFVRCQIRGFYVGDGCYDFDICGVPETACID